MKKFTEQLHTKASTVKLSAVERRELRERVVSYMEYHPLAAIEASAPKLTKRSMAAEPFTTVNFNFKKGRMWQWGSVTAAFLMVVTPVMAERAVPGDVLYAIKVQINEPVRSTLAFTPYQKVEWETELLNRRLAEARALASEGKLTGDVEVAIASAVKQHSENAKREIDALRESDAEEAALATIAFTTTLEVQSASLRGDDSDLALASTASVTLLESVINETLTKQASEETENTVLSFEKSMARVEINTTRVYELLEGLGEIDSETKQAVHRRLEDIERTVQEALTLRGGKDEAAIPLLVDSLERSQRLILFLSELQSGQSSQVEKYVPVVLTAEEKQSYKDRAVKTLNDQKSFILINLPNVEDPGTLEKLQVGLAEIETLMTLADSSTIFTDSQRSYEQAIAIGRDTIELYYSLDVEVSTATSTPVIEPVSTTTSSTDQETEATSTEVEIGS